MKNREIEQEDKLKKEEEEEEGLREREEGKKGRRKENLPCWVGMASQFSPKFFAFLLLQPLLLSLCFAIFLRTTNGSFQNSEQKSHQPTNSTPSFTSEPSESGQKPPPDVAELQRFRWLEFVHTSMAIHSLQNSHFGVTFF